MSEAIVTVQPTVKLYKRCAWKHHADCPGSFKQRGRVWSVCSCPCHDGQAPVLEAEVKAVVSAEVAEAFGISEVPGLIEIRPELTTDEAIEVNRAGIFARIGKACADTASLVSPVAFANLSRNIMHFERPAEVESESLDAACDRGRAAWDATHSTCEYCGQMVTRETPTFQWRHANGAIECAMVTVELPTWQERDEARKAEEAERKAAKMAQAAEDGTLETRRTEARLAALKPWRFTVKTGDRTYTMLTQAEVERNHKRGLDAWGFTREEIAERNRRINAYHAGRPVEVINPIGVSRSRGRRKVAA